MARALWYGALAVVMSAAAAPAQQVIDTSSTSQAIDGRLRAEIGMLRFFMRSLHVPAADSFRLGDQEIAAGSTFPGTAATVPCIREVAGSLGIG